jgi:hypothetical protein
MKPKKKFHQTNLFATLLAFAAMIVFAGLVWVKFKPESSSGKPAVEEKTIPAPEDNYDRPGTLGKLPEVDVAAIKRTATVVEWTDHYKVVFQVNFPSDTRSAFIVTVWNDRSKFLFSAIVDNRNDDWKKTLWLSYPMDENLEISNYPIPFESDEIRKLQWKFKKFEPYWNDPSHRYQLLTRDEWLSGMTIALLRKDSVK